jgi:hypothetical protein
MGHRSRAPRPCARPGCNVLNKRGPRALFHSDQCQDAAWREARRRDELTAAKIVLPAAAPNVDALLDDVRIGDDVVRILVADKARLKQMYPKRGGSSKLRSSRKKPPPNGIGENPNFQT